MQELRINCFRYFCKLFVDLALSVITSASLVAIGAPVRVHECGMQAIYLYAPVKAWGIKFPSNAPTSSEVLSPLIDVKI